MMQAIAEGIGPIFQRKENTMRQLIGLGVSLGVVALGSFCRRAIADERRRRAKAERKEAVATWEQEGGALKPPAQPQPAERPLL